MSYRCRLCEQQFAKIPETATPVGRSRHGCQLYMIDGQAHDLTEIRRPRIVGVVMPAPAATPPVEQTELLNTVFELLAEPPQLEAKPEIAAPERFKPEPDAKSNAFGATLAHAFRNFKM
jgi:hypothetical protein